MTSSSNESSSNSTTGGCLIKKTFTSQPIRTTKASRLRAEALGNNLLRLLFKLTFFIHFFFYF